MYTFILDIGKTNVKAYVLDDEGAVAWSEKMANSTCTTTEYPSINVDNIWSWMLGCLRTAAAQYAIRAINFSAHGACAVLLDKDGQLALPVMDYEFAGLETCAEEYRAVRPDYGQTLSPFLPMGLNLGRQLWWQQQNYPQAFANVATVLCYPQYWAWRLSGVAVSEVTSLGCHTDLWEPAKGGYSGLVAKLGLAQCLPALVSGTEPVGLIRPELAEDLGLPADCQIFPGVHDSNGSFARYLAADLPAPMTVVSAGTWVITLSVGADLARLDEHRDMLANVDVLGRPVACARFMGGREFGELCQLLECDVADAVAETDLAAVIAADAMVLPSFVPGTGPFPQRTGEVRGDRARGKALASLYMALMIDAELSLLGAQGDIVFGSTSTKNPLICQMVAQLRPQQRVLLSGDEAGTVTGTWCLTRWGQPAPGLSQFDVAKPTTLTGLDAYKLEWLAAING